MVIRTISGACQPAEAIARSAAAHRAVKEPDEPCDRKRGVGAFAYGPQDRIRDRIANLAGALQRLLALVGGITHDAVDAGFGVLDRGGATLGDLVERSLIILHAVGALFAAFRAAHGIHPGKKKTGEAI